MVGGARPLACWGLSDYLWEQVFWIKGSIGLNHSKLFPFNHLTYDSGAFLGLHPGQG